MIPAATTGGFAPATPRKTNTKTFLRRKNRKYPAPSRWSGLASIRQRKTEPNLPKLAPAR